MSDLTVLALLVALHLPIVLPLILIVRALNQRDRDRRGAETQGRKP